MFRRLLRWLETGNVLTTQKTCKYCGQSGPRKGNRSRTVTLKVEAQDVLLKYNKLSFEHGVTTQQTTIWAIPAEEARKFLLTVHPSIISQINPTRCTILHNIFIYFSSLHLSSIHVPIFRRNLLYPCVTSICHSVWVESVFSTCFGHPHAHHQEKNTVSMRHLYLSLCMGGVCLLYMFRASTCPSSGENNYIHASLVFVTLYVWRLQTPPIQSDKYQRRVDTVIFSWWWAHGCPKHVQKWNKYIKQNCAPSWTYLQVLIAIVSPAYNKYEASSGEYTLI